MKILLISDSHMLNGMEATILYEEADIAIHLGDSQFMANNIEMERFDFRVRGNCDFERYDEEIIITVNGTKWLLMHGHQVYDAHNYESLADYAKERGCQFVCFGHIHAPVFEKHRNVMVVNPGSFARSRTMISNSYMVIDVEEGSYKSILKDARSNGVLWEKNEAE